MKYLILNLFNDVKKPLKVDELVERLNLKDDQFEEFFSTLSNLTDEGQLIYTKKDKLCPPEFLDLYVGNFIYLRAGGKVKIKDTEYPVPKGQDKGAINNDTVLCSIIGKNKDKVQIVRIIKRNTETVIGTYKRFKKGGIVKGEGSRDAEVFIPEKYSNGAKQFDKVLCKITNYKENGNHQGKVITVFGPDRNLRANYSAILASYDIHDIYPKDAVNQAKEVFKQGVPQEALKGRLDLTNEKIFTIDSAEAKDLDDAIMVKKVGENYELSVHIADVSHYVTENSPLDMEAFQRGTSVYFADQVVPMLPYELSNFICSLNPGETRLTLSCFMTINKDGEVIDYKVKRSYIKSKIKGIYSEINAILDNEATDEIKEKYKDLMDEIFLIQELSDLLEKQKKKRGVLDFNIAEPKIIIENDRIADIVQRKRGKSDKLIENFMILANESVAKYMSYTYTPCIYRVHEEPDEEKTQRLIRISKMLGIKIRTHQGKLYSSSIEMLLDSIKGKDIEPVLSTMALRTMQKARYDSSCLGHYGLNLQYYLHFTSPIRRYPDLVVHRMLKKHLDGEINENDISSTEAFITSAAERSSSRENDAKNAERDIDKLYMADYMSDKIGEVFPAIISGVSDFGFFAELPNTIEGLVRMVDLKDDYYEYIEDRLMLKGQRSGKTYRLGDRILVQLVKSDITNRQIDFVPYYENESKPY